MNCFIYDRDLKSDFIILYMEKLGYLFFFFLLILFLHKTKGICLSKILSLLKGFKKYMYFIFKAYQNSEI